MRCEVIGALGGRVDTPNPPNVRSICLVETRRDVLLIGLEQPELQPLVGRLSGWARRTTQVATLNAALNALRATPHKLAILDAEALDVLDAVEVLLRLEPSASIVVLSRRPELTEAVRAGRAGVTEYIGVNTTRPLPLDWLMDRIELAWEYASLRSPADGPGEQPIPSIVGRSRAMRQVGELIRLVAPRQSTVLVIGRTGTGKELVAKAVHEASPRASQAMVKVNCGAIPENLLEAEFFGHVKGAFTGASSNRVGLFEQANRGTIFLDEISEMPLEMQAKLLRALQEREFQRVGSSESIKVDVRVIAAANCDLRERVRAGQFREDLYYRLNVVPIEIPSLAERIEDLPALVEHLLEKTCAHEGIGPKRAGREAIERLAEYGWPGNVRQLENAIQKAVILSGDRATLFPSDFELTVSPALEAPADAPHVTLPAGGLDYNRLVQGFERSLMQQALEMAAGNKKKAADLLRIKRTTFAARWKTLNDRELV